MWTYYLFLFGSLAFRGSIKAFFKYKFPVSLRRKKNILLKIEQRELK